MKPAVAYITPFSHPSHPFEEGAAPVFIGVFTPLHPFSGNFLYSYMGILYVIKESIHFIFDILVFVLLFMFNLLFWAVS